MAYRVELTPRAVHDLNGIYARVVREAPYRGPRWFDRLEQSILSLAHFPERCAAVPKLSNARRTVRQFLFGGRRHAYRVYFTIIDSVARVLHIRHAARKESRGV